MNIQGMKKAFRVFKEGTTTQGPIWIIYPENEKYNVLEKVGFYIWMGYTVSDIQA
jgi:hypothetical protein